MDDTERKTMKDDIYFQLRGKYEVNPESLSPEAKALLAILATTRYLDHYDNLLDVFEDYGRRVLAAEKIMDEVDAGTYTGKADFHLLILELLPLEADEFARSFPTLDILRSRAARVCARATHRTLNEREAAQGLPPTPFSEVSSIDLDEDPSAPEPPIDWDNLPDHVFEAFRFGNPKAEGTPEDDIDKLLEEPAL